MTTKTKVNLIQATSLEVGLSTDTDGYLYFDTGIVNKPGVRLNSDSSKLDYSNDGNTWTEIITPDVGGDISGTSYNASVVGFNNYPIDTATPPTTGQTTYYNSSSSKWTYSKPMGDISGDFTNVTIDKILGILVSTDIPEDKSTYLYDSGQNKWVPQVISTAGEITPYTIGGDCSGLIDNMKVVGFNGYPLETSQIPTDGQVRYYNSSQSKWWCSGLGGDVVGDISTVSIRNINGVAINTTSPPTNNQALVYNQIANQWIPQTITVSLNSLEISTVGGRLSLDPGTPYMTDPAGYENKTILDWVPINGGKIALYDGVNWNMITPGELSISVTGLSGNKNYDVFMSLTGGVSALVFGTAWTNDSTRAVELIKQDGVYVQPTTKYRYLGTIRTFADVTSSYTITEYDSPIQDFLYPNQYNLIYDSNHNRVYLIPRQYAVQTKWSYVNCITNETFIYYNGLVSGINSVNAYFGGAFDSVNNRIYLAPYGQANQDKWHYIDTVNNTISSYDNTAIANRPIPYAYIRGAFDSFNNRIYFAPYYQSNQTKWHYVDTTTNAVVAFDNIVANKPVQYAYNDCCFDSFHKRIYLSPGYQSNQDYWHYIDTNANPNTVIAFISYSRYLFSPYPPAAKSVLAYNGCAYDSLHKYVFLAPYNQTTQEVWHYIDTTTNPNTVIAYCSPYVYEPLVKYQEAAFDSVNNRIYFAPSWTYTGNQHMFCYVQTAPVGASVYMTRYNMNVESIIFNPIDNKIYLSPDLDMSIINIYVGGYVFYTSGLWVVPHKIYYYENFSKYLPIESAYNGITFDSFNNRVYFTPNLQYNKQWHYVNCVTNNIDFINNVSTNRAVGPYIGEGAFDSVNKRIYFAPGQNQFLQTKWHYVDTITNTVVSYTNTQPFSWSCGYAGAVFDSNHNRVYFVPYGQADQVKWHYVDTTTGNIVAYDNLISNKPLSAAYYNGAFDPINNRIYLAPYAQANQAKWHYIDTNTNTVIAYDNIYVSTIFGSSSNRPAANAYNGAVFNSNNNRIYFTPSSIQSVQTKWHYVNTYNNTVGYYSNSIVTTANRSDFIGNGAFLPNYNRIYFAPNNSMTTGDIWIYVNTITDTIVAYTGPTYPTYIKQNPYAGAVYNSISNKIYFAPYYTQTTQNKWHYIQIADATSTVTFESTTKNLGLWNYYNRSKTSLKLLPANSSWQIPVTTPWRIFNADINNNIKTLIGLKEDVSKFISIGSISGVKNSIDDGLMPEVFSFNNTSAISVAFAYNGSALDSVNNRIYFAPNTQANQAKWHYLDISTGLPVITDYNNLITDRAVSYAYNGAVFDSFNNRIYFAPYYQANQTKWHYVDTTTNPPSVVAFNNLITDRAIEAAYSGAVFDSVHNRVYLVPFEQARQAKWHYIDTTTNPPTVVAYDNPITDRPVYVAYNGGVFDAISNRIYLAPAYELNSTSKLHYINTNTNPPTVVAYNNVYTSDYAGSYNGAVFDNIRNRVYFIPGTQILYEDLHYIDTNTNPPTIVIYNNPLTNRPSRSDHSMDVPYSGGVFDYLHNRIYLVPFAQAIQSKWHYINIKTETPTIVAYDNPITDRPAYNAYSGGVFDAICNRVYFAPYNQAIQNKWHYIMALQNMADENKNCIIGIGINSMNYNSAITCGYNNNNDREMIVSYNGNTYNYYTAAYTGGVFDTISNKIYLTPYNQGCQFYWQYIDTTTNPPTFVNFDSFVSIPEDRPRTLFAYYGDAAFDYINNRIYFAPYYEASQPYWHYIDNSTNPPTVVRFPSVSPSSPLPQGAYSGAVFDSVHNKIFFAPYAQSNAIKWHYIDTTTNPPTVVAYANPLTNRPGSYGYLGASLDSVNNRVYFAPYYQANQNKWHYINTNTSPPTVVAFDNIVVDRAIEAAYCGAIFDSVHNRVYFAPYAQANQNKWHYIDTTASPPIVVAYDNPIINRPIENAYRGGVFNPINNRIYFAPYDQSSRPKWHYLDTNTNTVIAYDSPYAYTRLASSYCGAIFDPIVNRVYFSPYDPINNTNLQYINTNSVNEPIISQYEDYLEPGYNTIYPLENNINSAQEDSVTNYVESAALIAKVLA